MDAKRNKEMENILKTLHDKERIEMERKQRKKEVEKEYRKVYYSIPENKERHRQYQKQYYHDNKERILKRRSDIVKLKQVRNG